MGTHRPACADGQAGMELLNDVYEQGTLNQFIFAVTEQICGRAISDPINESFPEGTNGSTIKAVETAFCAFVASCVSGPKGEKGKAKCIETLSAQGVNEEASSIIAD